jgi:hypothetical protein
LKKNSPKKSTATCVLAVAQPPAITVGSAKSFALNQGTLTLILIFSVPFHAHGPTQSAVEKTLPVLGLWWLSVTATPPLVQQKTLLASTAFFASLGVLSSTAH